MGEGGCARQEIKSTLPEVDRTIIVITVLAVVVLHVAVVIVTSVTSSLTSFITSSTASAANVDVFIGIRPTAIAVLRLGVVGATTAISAVLVSVFVVVELEGSKMGAERICYLAMMK
eukprot:745797-Ditylum_brightwellii.AAC.1